MKQFDRAALAPILNEGIAALGLDLSADQTEKLLDYLALLAKWNSVYNLTSVRDPMQMLTLHVLDENDSPPAFVHSKYSCSVSAAAKEGDAVLMVSATDEDQGNDSIFFKEKSVFGLIFEICTYS